MKLSTLLAACFCVAGLLTAAQRVAAQAPPASAPKPQAAPARSDIQTRITIDVTGGAKDTPVENASVYVTFVEEHVINTDKNLQLNVKTSLQCVPTFPHPPIRSASV